MVAKVLITHVAVVLWLINMLLANSNDSPYALPGCIDRCGSTSISYPFGIGDKCFFNKWFEIDCRVEYRSPYYSDRGPTPFEDINSIEYGYTRVYYTPYLKSMGIEMLSVYENTLTALIQVNFSNNKCVSSYDLRGTPFSFSSWDNSFVGIGCNIISYTSNPKYDVGAWCASICNPDPYNVFGCEAQLQQNIQLLKPIILNTDQNGHIMSNSTRERKTATGFGFLAARYWVSDHQSHSSNPTSFNLNFDNIKKLPVYLDWELYNATSALFGANKTTTSCGTRMRWSKVNDSFYNSPKFQCSCRSGYEGSPYLPNGCQVSTNDEPMPEPESKHEINWKLAVICVCSTIGGLVLAFSFWCLYKVVKKEINRRKKDKYFKQNGGLLLQQQISSNDGNIDKTKVFSSYELEKATDNFNIDRVLGQGGQGTVYKGMLSDGRIVAIKKSILVDTANVGQFINEVVILSQINHRNIVKLLGCCLETEVPLLVYEFILNGTLFQHIHNPNEDFPLTWEIRLRIGAEIAGAISYMHSAASLPIYHRDIKSTNILLDEKYKAIVSDFGTSRSVDVDKTHFTTLVQGTFGYLDPEYFRSSQFTEKSDVYSFGVVLVELLTRHKPIFSNTSQEVKGLASHFIELMEHNQLLEIIDPQIIEESKIKQIVVVAQLAKMCLDMNGKRRPTMKEVAVQLEGIRMSREKSTTDDNYEGTENNGIDLSESFDSSLTSTGTWWKGITALSPDELPFLTYP